MHGFLGIFRGRAYLQNLERELKDYFGINHVFLVSSGKAALTVILRALRTLKEDRHEVLIPAYTCFSVPSSIVKAGLEVALCDIDSSSFDFDYKSIEGSLTERTLCVIPIHLFGIPADMDRISSIGKEKGIFVVEDAAQAMGGAYQGKKLGTLGDVGFFSLGRGKNITCGSGGIIITNSDAIASAIEKQFLSLANPAVMESLLSFCTVLLMNIFLRPSLYWFPSGLPFLRLGETIFHKDFPVKKFSGIQAGLMKNWKGRLEASNRRRRENSDHFSRTEGLRRHHDNSAPVLRLPVIAGDPRARNNIYSQSREKGMGISCMYPTSVDKISEIEDLFTGKSFPKASEIAERILTLPTHELLSEEDKRTIVQFLKTIPLSDLENPVFEGTALHGFS